MNPSKIEHLFRPAVFVPYAAITGTWNIKQVETSDGFTCKVIKQESIHILSVRGAELVSELYKMNVFKFITMWYNRFPFMSEMFFMYMELEKIEEK